FAEAVGQFEAVGVELESLGHARVARLEARQRGLRGGIFDQICGLRPAQLGFDLFNQYLRECIVPAGRIGDAHARGPRSRADIRSFQGIESSPLEEGLAAGNPLEWRGEYLRRYLGQ